MRHNSSSENGQAVLKPSWLARIVIMFPLSVMYKILRWIVPHVGDVWAKKIVYGMTWPVLFLLRQHRLTNMYRLFKPLGWTTQQCQTLDRSYLQHHVKLVVDSIRLMQFTPEEIRQRVIFEGEQHLIDALKKKRGVLLIGNHVGGWLDGLTFLSTCGYRVSGAAYEIPIRSIENHMKNLWRKHKLAITNVGHGATGAALQAFRRNEIFVVYSDVSLRPSRGAWFLLGSAAINVDMGPAKLAFMSDAPILRLSNHRQSDSRSVVSISPEIERAGNPVSLTQLWLDELYRELLSWPEQWWLLTLIPLKTPSSVPLSPVRETLQPSSCDQNTIS